MNQETDKATAFSDQMEEIVSRLWQNVLENGSLTTLTVGESTFINEEFAYELFNRLMMIEFSVRAAMKFGSLSDADKTKYLLEMIISLAVSGDPNPEKTESSESDE